MATHQRLRFTFNEIAESVGLTSTFETVRNLNKALKMCKSERSSSVTPVAFVAQLDDADLKNEFVSKISLGNSRGLDSAQCFTLSLTSPLARATDATYPGTDRRGKNSVTFKQLVPWEDRYEISELVYMDTLAHEVGRHDREFLSDYFEMMFMANCLDKEGRAPDFKDIFNRLDTHRERLKDTGLSVEPFTQNAFVGFISDIGFALKR